MSNYRPIYSVVAGTCFVCATVAVVCAVYVSAMFYTLKVRIDEQGSYVRSIGNRPPVIQVKPDVHLEIKPGLK